MTIRDVSSKNSSNSLTGVDNESAQLPEIPTKNSASKGQFQTTKDVMENAKSPNSVDQMFQPGPGQIPYGQSFPGSQVQFFGFGGPGIALGYASLNDEQSKAFSQMEKSPGWDSLREYQ
ncbi:MAG TPA: hypothetical protein VLH08_12695, partial [Acidobacteriota bacterium]|nr:hypothetical protein [Acidobacteriota bacterium]